MEYSIAPSEDGKYIVLKFNGEITRELAMQTNIEAHALGKKLEINRYLSDLRKVRNVDSPDFIETVAQNTGLDVTLFRDYEQAVQHLTKD